MSLSHDTIEWMKFGFQCFMLVLISIKLDLVIRLLEKLEKRNDRP